MMSIPVEHIRSNPFRDLGSDPLDDAHVETLRQSILQNGGWWGGVVGRPRKDGTVEIACGEHRVEAARRNAMPAVPVMISALSDHEMVRHLVSENNTQRSGKADNTVMRGAVAAAVKLLVRDIITGKVDEAVVPKHQLKQVQGQLRSRHGLGRDVVLRYMHDWPGVNCNQVRVALEQIKASGRYACIAKEVAADLRDQPHARQALRVARAALAHAGRTRKPLTRQRIADAAADKVFGVACRSTLERVRELEPLVAKLATAVTAGQRLDKDSREPLVRFTGRLIAMLNADREAAR